MLVNLLLAVVLWVQVPQWSDDWSKCAVDVPDAACHWYVAAPDSKLKPYVLYIIISLFFLSLIRGTFKMDRNERNIRLQQELCKVDEVYCK